MGGGSELGIHFPGQERLGTGWDGTRVGAPQEHGQAALDGGGVNPTRHIRDHWSRIRLHWEGFGGGGWETAPRPLEQGQAALEWGETPRKPPRTPGLGPCCTGGDPQDPQRGVRLHWGMGDPQETTHNPHVPPSGAGLHCGVQGTPP